MSEADLIKRLKDALDWSLGYIDSEFSGSNGRLLLHGEERVKYDVARLLLKQDAG